MSDYAQTFSPPITGPQTIRLAAGALIQALTVVNNSNGTVNVFASPGSPGVGTPDFALLPNAQSTTPINSLSSVALTFTGTVGTVYVHAIDQPLSAQSSAIQVASPNQYAAAFHAGTIAGVNGVTITGGARTNQGIGVQMLFTYDNVIYAQIPIPIKPALNSQYNSTNFFLQRLIVTGLQPQQGWAFSSTGSDGSTVNPSVHGNIWGYGNANLDFKTYPNPAQVYQTNFGGSGPLYTYTPAIYFFNIDGVPGGPFPFTAHAFGYIA